MLYVTVGYRHNLKMEKDNNFLLYCIHCDLNSMTVLGVEYKWDIELKGLAKRLMELSNGATIKDLVALCTKLQEI
jgi:hypothetical protein